jgi:hypothetical protein
MSLECSTLLCASWCRWCAHVSRICFACFALLNTALCCLGRWCVHVSRICCACFALLNTALCCPVQVVHTVEDSVAEALANAAGIAVNQCQCQGAGYCCDCAPQQRMCPYDS